LLVWIIKR